MADERQDIVAGNGAAAALITDFGLLPAEERNIVRLSLRPAGTLCSEPAGADSPGTAALAQLGARGA